MSGNAHINESQYVRKWSHTLSLNYFKYKTTKSVSCFRTIFIFAFGIITLVSLSCYTGLVIYAAFHDCDPVTTKVISKSDQLLPYFVMKITSHVPALPGIFVSGVFSAALRWIGISSFWLKSTILESSQDSYLEGIKKQFKFIKTFSVFSLSTMSTGLNSMTGVILIDFIRPLCKEPLSEAKASFYMKIMVAVLGVIFVILAFVVDQLGALIQV